MKILTQLPFTYNKLTMGMGGGLRGKVNTHFYQICMVASLKCNENLVMKETNRWKVGTF